MAWGDLIKNSFHSSHSALMLCLHRDPREHSEKCSPLIHGESGEKLLLNRTGGGYAERAEPATASGDFHRVSAGVAALATALKVAGFHKPPNQLCGA